MDVGDSEQKTMSLVVKTPNQAHGDQKVEGVRLNWTVKDLKTHLSTAHPGRPAVCDQRLIYAGKLMPDHLHIRDIFRQADSIPTLHLVCASRNQPQKAQGTRPKTPEAEQPRPSGSTPPSTPELRQRRQTSPPPPAALAHTRVPVSSPGVPSWPGAAMHGAPQMAHTAFPTYSLYSRQQLLWLQQVYARQYYMQYQAALAAAGNVPSAPAAATIGQYPPVPAHQVPVPAPLANQNPINNLPENRNPAPDGDFINPGQVNQNLRLNAQGGPVMEDEEDVERDWLDWLYSATRLGVLLMIMYFNSNLSRFLLVMATLLIMYLHTAGWFPFRRRVQVQVPNHLEPPEVQHNQQNDNRDRHPADEVAGRPREEPVAAADGSDEEEPAAAVLVPPHRVSVMWTAWVFFKAFFSSLIPEIPHGVAN